jgi:acyl carrier protein
VCGGGHNPFRSDMSNLEKYNHAFAESLSVDERELPGLAYQAITTWDSVGHMGLVAALEDAFGIMLEMDDILDLSSYEKGMEILARYQVDF